MENIYDGVVGIVRKPGGSFVTRGIPSDLWSHVILCKIIFGDKLYNVLFNKIYLIDEAISCKIHSVKDYPVFRETNDDIFRPFQRVFWQITVM